MHIPFGLYRVEYALIDWNPKRAKKTTMVDTNKDFDIDVKDRKIEIRYEHDQEQEIVEKVLERTSVKLCNRKEAKFHFVDNSTGHELLIGRPRV